MRIGVDPRWLREQARRPELSAENRAFFLRQAAEEDRESALSVARRREGLARSYELLGGDQIGVYRRQCKMCGESFHAARPRAKFCSPRCRKAFHKWAQRQLALLHLAAEAGCIMCRKRLATTERGDYRRFYCSAACRQKAYRARRATDASPRSVTQE